MTTEKQIDANRQNALASTGPRTDEGKALVAGNAAKHGVLASPSRLLANEDPEEVALYENHRLALFEDLQPQGAMERYLVEKIALDQWRLRRLMVHEAGLARADRFFAKLKGWREMLDKWPDDDEALPRVQKSGFEPRKVTKQDLDKQSDLVKRMANKRVDLTQEEWALRFVYLWKLGGEAKPKDWPEGWREQAREYIAGLSPQMRGRIRAGLHTHAKRDFAAMNIHYAGNMIVEFESDRSGMPEPEQIETILRYERALERSIERNLEKLQTLQERRQERGDAA